MHDTGYIQSVDDTEGTGAKYTLTHVERSVDFANHYLEKKSYPEYAEKYARIIRYTDLSFKYDGQSRDAPEIETVGRMLGSADLIGQTADRLYLEKLFFLFCEFNEGNVPGYTDETEL